MVECLSYSGGLLGTRGDYSYGCMSMSFANHRFRQSSELTFRLGRIVVDFQTPGTIGYVPNRKGRELTIGIKTRTPNFVPV